MTCEEYAILIDDPDTTLDNDVNEAIAGHNSACERCWTWFTEQERENLKFMDTLRAKPKARRAHLRLVN